MATPRWRVWTYEAPALVLGCAQRALYEQLRATPGGPPLPVLLRDAGGGAVLAGPWLVGLSVVLPIGHAWLGQGLLDSYRRLGQLHADALADLGISARPLPPAQLAATRAAFAAQGQDASDWACFGSLSPWEVVDAEGRKLVGLAQRRRRSGALLVAGTLVAEPDWGLLCAAVGRPMDAPPIRGRTVHCGRLLGQALSAEACAGALARRCGQLFG